jgi:hypothetical protein
MTFPRTTDMEANALRLHYLLTPNARRLPWWMYGREWQERAIRRWGQFQVCVEKANEVTR